MSEYSCVWEVQHRKGDKNLFGEYFTAHNFTWRLALVSGKGHYVFLEHFGHLTFDVFTDYTLRIEYADGETEIKEETFAFGCHLDFGTQIQDKQTQRVSVRIDSATRCYESKKDTPYAGLINLGSTCYLNTLVQTLFHIKGFENEIFKQPSTKKTKEMQKLFYKLEKENTYVDTLSFAHAFKLNEPIDDQQDIQEFFKVLLDELEKEAKGTPFFKYIEDTFYGSLGSLIECEKGCISERTEKYNDIQLVIEENGYYHPSYQMDSNNNIIDGEDTSLENSLKAYINTTYLEAPNLYNCEKHGYVQATKKDYFKTFPPVLFLQIKRFNMDYDTGNVYKLNNKFSFPERIDLSPYSLQETEPNTYSIYSVNVHQGDGMSEGHYYTYIKKNNSWYKFNDCYVTRSSAREAIEGTFGGMHEYKNKQIIANAYYLVYIKDTEKEKLLDLSIQDVPENIQATIERDKYLMKKIEIQLYTPEIIQGYWGIGPLSTKIEYMDRTPICIKVENQQQLSYLKIHCKKSLGLLDGQSPEVLVYEILPDNQSHKLRRIKNIDMVGSLESKILFTTYLPQNIEEEEAFILFVKTEKTVDQPYNLKVATDIKEILVTKKTDNVQEWLRSTYSTNTSNILAEIHSQAALIPENISFEELFKGEEYGIIVLDAGLQSLNEYFLELSTHKIVTVITNEYPVLRLWVEKTVAESKLIELVSENLKTTEFQVANLEETALYLQTPPGTAVVQISLLGDRTENTNLLQKITRILPETITGEEFLKTIDYPKDAITSKTRILKTYFGSEQISVSKPSHKLALKNTALLTVQNLSKSKHAEASIKYNSETIGHPFFIDVEPKRSVLEAKRKYGLEGSTVIRLSAKKQILLEDQNSLKKHSTQDKFVFAVTFFHRIKLQSTKSYAL
ncbi:ubiquitin carboxyl-terminal hydrolase 7 [Nematocida sp. AWRm80]|nr:ubiquitin carboxyl-terminal hydrolase 7 [Nematocida sp. AWRm80]